MRMLYVVTLLATVATSTARDLCGGAVDGTTGIIDVGESHTCARNSLGAVACWGSNVYGQLGNGDGGINKKESTPVAVLALTEAVDIAAGYRHTCALLSTGGVKCWGYNGNGQLGDGDGGSTTQYTPVAVSGLTDAVAIAAGHKHTCALLSTGGAKCWGSDSNGQLGDGDSNTDKNTPVDVSGLTGAVAIAAGGDPIGGHTCALLNTSRVKCWGYNLYGQLGNGEGGFNTEKTTPVDVPGLGGVVAIAAGGAHTCAVLNTTGVKCWGGNNYGQLGNAGASLQTTPVDVLDLIEAVAIAAGRYHTCALLSTGGVKCWGSNNNGQLGNGDGGFNKKESTPVDVVVDAAGTLLKNAVAIAAGEYHTCAVLSTGQAKCWGLNSSGQLGDGTNLEENTPVDVFFDACWPAIEVPFYGVTPGIHLKGCEVVL